MSLLQAPTAQTISVALGCSVTIRCGEAARVTARPRSSVNVTG
jgi:hypothetical protein